VLHFPTWKAGRRIHSAAATLRLDPGLKDALARVAARRIALSPGDPVLLREALQARKGNAEELPDQRGRETFLSFASRRIPVPSHAPLEHSPDKAALHLILLYPPPAERSLRPTERLGRG